MFGRPHTHTYMHSRFSLKPINQLRVFLFILFWSFLGWFFLFAVTVMVCGAFIRTLEVFCFLFFRHNLLFNFCLSPSPSLSVCECVWVVHSHPTWWYLTFIIYLFDVSPFPFFYSCFTFMFLAFIISFPFPYSTTWNLRHQDVPPVFFSSSSAAVQMDSSPFVHDAICDIRCYAFAVLSLLFLFIITTDYNLIYPIPPLALSYSHISMYLSSACVDFRSPHPTIRKKKWILLGV